MGALTAIILLALLLMVGLASRRWALVALTAGIFYLTQGHYILAAGVEFTPIRFLEVAGFARVAARRELSWSDLNRVDWALLILYNYTAVIWMVGPTEFSFRPFSLALDGSLCYLAFRGLIKNIDDVRWFLSVMTLLLVPYTALVALERQTGQSSFAMVGGSWELYTREGVPRAQGAFRHAILLGAVAAAFLPLYIGLWLEGRRRVVAGLGVILCLVLVALSNSGIPLTAAATAVLGWCFWVVRHRMGRVRLATAGVLAILPLVMEDKIWYLTFKVSQIVGGAGYHRSVLMDMAWQSLDKWWLMGMRIEETASWFPYLMYYGGADVTNQYITFGLRGGLLAVLLCMGVLALGYSNLGTQLARARRSTLKAHDEFLLWGLGVTMFVHIVTWTSVMYFDQTYAIWLMHLALLVGCSARACGDAPQEFTIARSRPQFLSNYLVYRPQPNPIPPAAATLRSGRSLSMRRARFGSRQHREVGRGL